MTSKPERPAKPITVSVPVVKKPVVSHPLGGEGLESLRSPYC